MRGYFLPEYVGIYSYLFSVLIQAWDNMPNPSTNLARDRRLGWFQFSDKEYQDYSKTGHGYDWPGLARVLLTGPT